MQPACFPFASDTVIRHVFREEYGTFKLTADDSDGRLLEGLYHFILRLHHEWPLLVCLIVPGLLSLCRRAGPQRWFAVTSMSSVVFYLVMFHYMANIELHNKPDQQNIVRRFWLMPFIVRPPHKLLSAFLFSSLAVTQPHHWARLSCSILLPAFQHHTDAIPRLGCSRCVGIFSASKAGPKRE